MGIYDREYIRREGPSFLGSFAQRGQICKWLIGINVVVFILQMATSQSSRSLGPVTDALILDVDRVLGGEIWRLLTYAFLHETSTPWHILFNMLFLWWFGSDVEDLYGPREFLAIYLVSAVLGGVVYVLTNLSGGYCLGASGAVTCVMVLCALHYPSRVILLFFVLPVPIWIFVVFMVAKDAFAFFGGRGDNGVAVAVHLAGALFGFVYYKLHWNLTSWWSQVKTWKKRRSRPRLRVYREEEDEPAPVPTIKAAPALASAEDEQLEAKMDAVLEKISRVGKENLTESEREVLLKASEIFKRRRG
jgi:membrane associated rhomboid family serine protease